MLAYVVAVLSVLSALFVVLFVVLQIIHPLSGPAVSHPPCACSSPARTASSHTKGSVPLAVDPVADEASQRIQRIEEAKGGPLAYDDVIRAFGSRQDLTDYDLAAEMTGVVSRRAVFKELIDHAVAEPA